MRPSEINPVQWSQAIGLARQSCAHLFRDGGNPADALRLHGLSDRTATSMTWDKAIKAIAQSLCRPARAKVAARPVAMLPRFRVASVSRLAPERRAAAGR